MVSALSLFAGFVPLLALRIGQDVTHLSHAVAHELTHLVVPLLRRERGIVPDRHHLLIAIDENRPDLLLLSISQIEHPGHAL